MAYIVRANRDTDGYTVAYGKGKKKLTLRLLKLAPTRWSFVNAPSTLQGTYGSFAEAKAAFETWAVREYGVESGTDEENPLVVQAESGHDQPRIPPPPSFGRIKPPLYTKPKSDVASSNIYVADPFNPAFYDATANQRTLTPLGALMEVWNYASIMVPWEKRFTEFPWVNVAKTLRRAFPNAKQFVPPAQRGK